MSRAECEATGLRITALTAIPMADVDLSRGWLTVRAELQKQQAEQLFELHPDTIACLAKMPPGRKMLFPLPIRLQSLRERLRRLLTEAGLQATRYELLHKLRRTSGTAACAVAGETAAQYHLGHSSPRMIKAYIDPWLIKGPGMRDDFHHALAGLSLRFRLKTPQPRFALSGLSRLVAEIVSAACTADRRRALLTDVPMLSSMR